MEKRENLIGGVIAGAAAGFLAGVLLAPDKGSATRASISRRGKDSVNGLKSKVNDMVDKVADKYLTTEGRTSSSKGPSSKETEERRRPANSGFQSPEAL